jgi:hypothetical protein
MITARYRWEIETLRKAFAIHYKTLWAAKLAVIIGILSLFAGGYKAVTSEHGIESLPLILFGALSLSARSFAFWQFRRAVRRSSNYGSEMTYMFAPEQVIISGEGHHSTFTWNKLHSATESREGILLYTLKTVFHWIPVTAFPSPSDLATVHSYLEQNGVRIRNA